MSSVVWLQRRTGLGFQLWDCGLFTVARVAQRYWFVGALNTWLPVPVTWMATLITHSRSLMQVRPVARPGCWRSSAAFACHITRLLLLHHLLHLVLAGTCLELRSDSQR